MSSHLEVLRERLYSAANHFDSMRKALPADWQDFAVEHSNELRHLIGELDTLAAPSPQQPAEPQQDGGAVATFFEQMDMLRGDFLRYQEGDARVPFVVLRDAMVGALNAYTEAESSLRSTTPQPAARRVTERQAEVIAFLLGEAPLDGQWYGDRPDNGNSLWWRKALRDSFANGGA